MMSCNAGCCKAIKAKEPGSFRVSIKIAETIDGYDRKCVLACVG